MLESVSGVRCDLKVLNYSVEDMRNAICHISGLTGNEVLL